MRSTVRRVESDVAARWAAALPPSGARRARAKKKRRVIGPAGLKSQNDTRPGPTRLRPGAPPHRDHGLGQRVELRLLVGRQLIADDRKSTRLNSSHVRISYAVFCLKKKKR